MMNDLTYLYVFMVNICSYCWHLGYWTCLSLFLLSYFWIGKFWMAFICNLGWHTKVSVFVLLMTRMNNTNPNKKLGWSQFPCYTDNTRRSTLVKYIICLQLDTDYMANIHWIVFFNDNLLNYLGCIAPKHLQIIRL